MKKTITTSIIALALATTAPAQTTVTLGHWDISAHEHEGLLEAALHNHDTEAEESLDGSTIRYTFTGAKGDVTVGASDLGQLWVTPESEVDADTAGMPFIGFSAEELAAPFTGSVTFTMTGFSYTGSGSGNFYLFEDTDLFWDSTAGPGSYGSFSVNVGQHGHGEFGFSDAGLYAITLEASGNNGSPIGGESATFTFDVVPEPSTYALLGLGTLALAWHLRRRKA